MKYPDEHRCDQCCRGAAAIERLESRQLLAAAGFCRGELIVRGGNGDDLVGLSASATHVTVNINGAESSFLVSKVKRIVVLGGRGNDDIAVNDGDGTFMLPLKIDGGSGNDSISSGSGNDLLQGGCGDDIIFGFGGDDRICGGGGADLITGGDGNDRVHGGAGNDTLGGGGGDDFVHGGLGNDEIFGEDGDDAVGGGAGIDLVDGGAGADSFLRGDRDLERVIDEFDHV